MSAQKPPPLWPWLVLLILLLPLVGLAAFKVVQHSDAWANQHAQFREHMAEYAIAPHPPEPGQPKIPLGKVVVANIKDGLLDELHFQIPEDLRATKPEEVVTIVQTRPTKREVGKYEGGGRAIQEDYEIAVVDKATGTLLAEAKMTGPEPPKSISRASYNQDVSGGGPIQELNTLLGSLQ